MTKQRSNRGNRKPKRLYIITDGEYYKVGVSSTPGKRLKSLQTSNARKLRIIHLYNGSYGMRFEALVHALLAQHRVSGEWFDCSLPQIHLAIARAEEVRPVRKAQKGKNWKAVMRQNAPMAVPPRKNQQNRRSGRIS